MMRKMGTKIEYTENFLTTINNYYSTVIRHLTLTETEGAAFISQKLLTTHMRHCLFFNFVFCEVFLRIINAFCKERMAQLLTVWWAREVDQTKGGGREGGCIVRLLGRP